jgi:hypothetical protein
MAAIKQLFVDNIAGGVKSAALRSTALSTAGESLEMGRFQSLLGKNGQEILADNNGNVDDVIRAFATLKDKTSKQQSMANFGNFMHNLAYGNGIHNAIMDAQLLNPRIPLEKSLTDLVHLPYMALMRSASTAYFHKNIPAGVKMWQASTHGYFTSLIDGWNMAKQSFKSDAPAYEESLGIKAPHTYGDDFTETTSAGIGSGFLQSVARAYNVVAHPVNAVMGVGKRGTLALDQWDKFLARSMAVNAQAYYRALNDAEGKGLSGSRAAAYATIQGQKYAAQMPQWLKNLSNNNMAQDSFTDDDYLTTGAQKVVSGIPFGKVAAPWVRTPIDLMEQGMINSPLAPITPKFQRDLLTGDDQLTANTDRARMALGSALFGHLVNATVNGNITGDGPSDPATLKTMMDMGFTPRTVRFGTHAFGYDHLPLVGTVMAMAANYAQYSSEMPDESAKSYAQLASKLMSNLVTHGPFVESMLQMADAIRNWQRAGITPALGKYTGELASQVIPQPLAEIAKLQAPYVKELVDPTSFTRSAMNVIMSKLPGFSKDVPAYRDWQGNVQYIPPGNKGDDVPASKWHTFINDSSPIPFYNTQDLSNVDQEMASVGYNPSRVPYAYGGPNMQNIPNSPKAGVPISGPLRDRIAILSGHELKIDGMNQTEYMSSIINSADYKNLDEEFAHDPTMAKYWKAQYLQGVHQAFMQTAIQQVLFKEHPEFGQKYMQKEQRMAPEVH